MYKLNKQKNTNSKTAGVTLVELVAMITVIGILATITYVSYMGWQKNVSISQLKSDLNGAASAMENYRTFNNTYPSTVPSTFKPSDTVTLVVANGGTTYCIDATTTKDATLTYYIDSNNSTIGAKAGTCATR